MQLAIAICDKYINNKSSKYSHHNKSPFYEHENCHCYFDIVNQIYAGTATINIYEGADYYIIHNKTLPDYYITKSTALESGWRKYKANLHKIAPGKMIGGDMFLNKDNKLPSAEGRIWYEADINYISGFRNAHRILYSNDGLVFVIYDHYNT